MSSFQGRDIKLARFIAKNQHRCLIILLIAEIAPGCKKLDTILENKVIKKLRLSKNFKSNKCAPIWISKRNHSDSDSFCYEKLCLFTKFNNYHIMSRFLTKTLANFVSLSWKLDNPSCHILHTAQSKCNCLQRNGTKEGHITSRVGECWMRLILGRATMNDHS